LKPRTLLVGYNGASNTGAEAKLLAIIDELRLVLGPEACLTVPSLNEANLRRYLRETPYLQIKSVRPSTFFLDARRFVKENDLILFVEGSCYMDTWGSALLWYYLLTTRYAHGMGKPCIAYSVDAGQASRFNSWLIKREASKTDLIITRTQAAAERLKKWQVTAPIEVTADNAFAFKPDSADENLLERLWPEASNIVGVAAEDIYLWPVVIRPWGHRKYRYRWPYYYSRSHESLEKSELLADVLAVQADEIIENHDKSIALISMESLDSSFVYKVQEHMKHRERTRVFTSQEYNASQMTNILRRLEMLITSRYHAAVLSLANQIPQTAIGHDLRIKDLYTDLGIPEYFVDHEDPDRYKALSDNVENLLSDDGSIREKLRIGYEQYVSREKRNPILLKAFLEEHYPEWIN
jgi:polysaccharide pyruvyl transferase WcaK-like protein